MKNEINIKFRLKQKLLRDFVFAIICLLMTSNTFAIFIPKNYPYKILSGKEIEYIIDEQRAFSIETLPFEKFKSYDIHSPNFGLYDGLIWIKLDLEAKSQRELFLELKNPIIDFVEVYEKTKTGYKCIAKFGDRYPFEQREYKHRFFRAKIKIPNEIIIRVNNLGDLLLIPTNIATEQGLKSRDKYGQFLWGVYFGLIIVFISINLLLYIFNKMSNILWYIGYLVSISIVQFCFSGFGYQYFWSNMPEFTNRILPFAGAFSIVFVLIYTRNFLNLKRTFPLFYRLFRLFEISSILIGFLQFIPTHFAYLFGVLAVNIFILASSLLISVAAILSARKHVSHPLIYFFIAIFCIIAGTATFILRNFGLIPDILATEYSLQISTASFAGFLTLTILREYKDNKIEAINNLKQMDLLRKNEGSQMDEEIKYRTQEYEAQKEEIANKNKEILNSIAFAGKIQSQLLPNQSDFVNQFDSGFLLFLPKDILSGDFYWYLPFDMEGQKNTTVFCIGDSTGHGVPGAMISVLALRFLSSAVLEFGHRSTADILNYVGTEFNKSFLGNTDRSNINDGMDCMICIFNRETNLLTYSGAKNGIVLIRDNQLLMYYGDKQSIGGIYESKEKYLQNTLQLQVGDKVYLFTDGFIDQFGGPNDKKLKIGEARKLLLKHHHEPMEKQKQIISDFFQRWKKGNEQTDDVTFLAFSVDK